MSQISISFKAYIPKSLGKSLLSYFEKNPFFKPGILSNYYEFKNQLEAIDRQGYHWLPEPGGFITKNFFSTDKADFHKLHTDEHSNRLQVDLSLDTSKIGDYSFFDTSNLFKHEEHNDSGNSSQHSDESHRVKAYIQMDMNDTSLISQGILSPMELTGQGYCSAVFSKRSTEAPLKTKIINKLSGTYFTMPGSRVKDDTSVIEFSASAGYPFLEAISPNIDFTISVAAFLNNKTVEITINGEHNDFPAYELLVDNKSIYSYNPADHGYTGPNPHNLNVKRKFTTKLQTRVSDLEIKDSLIKNKKKGIGY